VSWEDASAEKSVEIKKEKEGKIELKNKFLGLVGEIVVVQFNHNNNFFSISGVLEKSYAMNPETKITKFTGYSVNNGYCFVDFLIDNVSDVINNVITLK
jgi:hypothetical protein